MKIWMYFVIFQIVANGLVYAALPAFAGNEHGCFVAQNLKVTKAPSFKRNLYL
jgi:hypothetical protein